MTAGTRDRAEDGPHETVLHGAFVNRVFRNRFDVLDSPRYEVVEPTESSARRVRAEGTSAAPVPSLGALSRSP